MIDAFPVVRLSSATYEKRGTHEGFIRAELCFVDGSTLYVREFVDVEVVADRVMYAYQFIDSSQKLVFRYDNTGHHRKLGLSTYPHHKHDGIGKGADLLKRKCEGISRVQIFCFLFPSSGFGSHEAVPKPELGNEGKEYEHMDHSLLMSLD
jgi:hypothetical protein